MNTIYDEIIKKIDEKVEQSCFSIPSGDDIQYLNSINVPSDVKIFYSNYNPREIIEFNGIRLLPLLTIKEENIDAIPGYILFPLGYCVIASTVYGDVYCIKQNEDKYSIVFASHEEIYEGVDVVEISQAVKETTESFLEFLTMFYEEKLKDDYYK